MFCGGSARRLYGARPNKENSIPAAVTAASPFAGGSKRQGSDVLKRSGGLKTETARPPKQRDQYCARDPLSRGLARRRPKNGQNIGGDVLESNKETKGKGHR